MKIHIATIILSMTVGFLGGVAGHYFFRGSPLDEESGVRTSEPVNPQNDAALVARLDRLQERLHQIESTVLMPSRSENPGLHLKILMKMRVLGKQADGAPLLIVPGPQRGRI
ncbi:MAG: hypothetical protein CMQ19_09240 [Gammaproteobacteria bacterium]|jgi:hypothetical protein|nr:hypothetical protein [Gammaproteobacteria bacterium]